MGLCPHSDKQWPDTNVSIAAAKGRTAEFGSRHQSPRTQQVQVRSLGEVNGLRRGLREVLCAGENATYCFRQLVGRSLQEVAASAGVAGALDIGRFAVAG